MPISEQRPACIYTYASPVDEISLCGLELRALFGIEPPPKLFISEVRIDPSRSPFLKERIEIMYQEDSLPDIVKQVEQIHLLNETFKVIFVKTNDLDPSEKIDFEEQRAIERKIGWVINGEADVRRPDHVYGIVTLGGRWYFGPYLKNQSVWLDHMNKPRNYSIALSTRVARAAANIAVPQPEGKKAIDPCCGIGTVLIEALSMGIDIVGRDSNHFIASGARENLAHFQFESEVACGLIEEVTDHYDVAVIDMPYNHFSTTTPEAQFSILKHARRIANRAVIITIETIDDMVEEAGFRIIDRGVAKKGGFTRQLLVCV